jgi:hypothetical protein
LTKNCQIWSPRSRAAALLDGARNQCNQNIDFFGSSGGQFFKLKFIKTDYLLFKWHHVTKNNLKLASLVTQKISLFECVSPSGSIVRWRMRTTHLHSSDLKRGRKNAFSITNLNSKYLSYPKLFSDLHTFDFETELELHLRTVLI